MAGFFEGRDEIVNKMLMEFAAKLCDAFEHEGFARVAFGLCTVDIPVKAKPGEIFDTEHRVYFNPNLEHTITTETLFDLYSSYSGIFAEKARRLIEENPDMEFRANAPDPWVIQ